VAELIMGPLIIFNVISVSVELGDPAFKFFWYAPMWHSAEIIRFIISVRPLAYRDMHVRWSMRAHVEKRQD